MPWEWEIMFERAACDTCGKTFREGVRAWTREISPETSIYEEYTTRCALCMAEYLCHLEDRIREYERREK